MKRLISLFISVLIVMSTPVYAFEDVPDDASYLEDIESAVEAGIVNGVGDERFAPDEYVTVSQFVLMLNRTFGFSDYIGVDDVLTVENACYLLDECIRSSFLELVSYEPSMVEGDFDNHVSRCLWYGLIHDKVDGFVTRAEAVKMVVRLMQAYEGAEEDSGVVYSDLIRGDYDFVETHSVDDIEAIDNNVRYLIKACENELLLKVDEIGESKFYAGTDYGDAYLDVLQNYPEFGLKYVWSEMTGDGLKLEFSGLPMDFERLSEYQGVALRAAIRVRDNLYMAGKLNSYMTQREKARVYYDWLVDHCDYDWDSFNGRSRLPFAWMSYGPIVYGYATCQGYTAAFNLFMRLEGIECSTERTPHHIWSVATLDGETYHIDATWSDMCETDSEPYFCMPDGSLVEGYGL